MNRILLSLSLLSLALLQACGGGGHDDGAGIAPPPTSVATGTGANGSGGAAATTSTGSVSAPFVRSSSARYQLFGVGTQSFGNLTASEQAPGGAMTKLNDNVLSGASVTKDIAGDANFALGRWVAGTLTRDLAAETLTGADGGSYHYLAMNNLAALPAPRGTTCDAGVFTAPSYVGGGAGVTVLTGVATGAATLAFNDDGGAVAGTVTVSVAGAVGTVKLDATVQSVTSTSITGNYFSGGSGAAIALGSHGADAYLIAAGYSATLPSGARYSGVAKFRCA